MGISYGDSRAALGKRPSSFVVSFPGERISAASGRFKLNGARLATTPLQQRLPILSGGYWGKGPTFGRYNR